MNWMVPLGNIAHVGMLVGHVPLFEGDATGGN